MRKDGGYSKKNECLQAFKLRKPEQVTRGNNAVKRFFLGGVHFEIVEWF